MAGRQAPNLTLWMGQTINYEAYDEGQRFLGHASIDLPEMTYMAQDISGAGIAGTVNLPSRWITESLTLTAHWRSMTQYTFHLAEQDNHDVTFYGAINGYNSGESGVAGANLSETRSRYTTNGVHEAPTDFRGAGQIRAVPIKIMTRLLPKKVTFGKFQVNEMMESESEFELTYMKVWVDNEEMLELDKFNYTLTINGVSYADDVRSALGLG